MKKYLFIAGFGALLFTACSGDGEDTAPNTPKESSIIQFQGSVVGTRATGTDPSNYTDIQNTFFSLDERVDIYISRSDGGVAKPSYSQPIRYTVSALTANGGGYIATLVPTTGFFPYYQNDEGDIDVYALYPSGSRTAVANTYFRVEADQTSEAGYKSSDLMYAKTTDIPVSGAPIDLTFNHLMSKVIVKLEAGKGTPNLTNAKVRVLNVARTLNMPANGFKTGTIGTADMTTNVGDVRVSNNGVYESACILPPQDVNPGKFLEIRVFNEDGVEDLMTYWLPQSLTFESGKSYRFKVTVNKENLNVAYTVEPWIQETVITGEMHRQ